ncbi:subtilisin family serine protease [Nitrosomonas oligotropha]|uniref:Subtilisin family serine protease n=1 Tax=Nitrosomonas oligotropha TaxID=42354 RepID=A0A2T5I4Q2_9PROT|nr:S8 family serine peptidase [Nitrosomonas oligotropha]PTQ78802.1 subtilisin family serine protease [Nitrosomonas oligotropha]
MESNKQSLQAVPSSLPHSHQSHSLSTHRPGLTKRTVTAISQIGIFLLIASLSATSIAASPEQANDHPIYNPSSTASTKSVNFKSSTAKKWAKGRILVVPRAGLPAQAFANILKDHEGKARKIGQSELYIVDVPEYSEEVAVAKLQHHPHLKFAELDHIVSPSMIPNDPYFTSEWHLSKIGAPSAWDIAQGSGITIAILDSGVAANHPDLASNMIPGWNFYDNNSNTSDVIGHGTIVAGSAVATTNNNTGIAAVASQSKIMPLRVTDTNGYGYESTISQALIYAADNGVRVANVSFQDVSSSPSIRNAAQYMKDKYGLVVVSAGNTGSLESYTVTTSLIPVAATDQYDTKTKSSSYGDFVALAAPGDNIWSTNNNSSAWYAPFAGTSFASPVAGGVIALMMSANPQLGSIDIENLLFSTAVDLGAAGKDVYFGYGRVNAAAAVLAAKNATPTIDSTAPATFIIDPLGGATVSGLIPVDVDATDNAGVARVELWINNTNIATDTSSPFAFSWDTAGAPNGTAKVEARAYDTTGNLSTASISVNVSNSIATPSVDTQAPAVTIVNPVAGSVTGTVTISTSASDNSGPSGIKQYIYIDGALVTTGTGSTLSYSWSTRSKKVKAGSHTIQAIAKDAAGNSSSAYVTVNVK